MAQTEGISEMVTDMNYQFSTDENAYKQVLDNANSTDQEIYAIYLNEDCRTHLFDVLEDDFIRMADLGLINTEGSYYLLKPSSFAHVNQLRKTFATGFKDIFEKL